MPSSLFTVSWWCFQTWKPTFSKSAPPPYSLLPIMCHKDKRSPSFHWILRWGDILTGDQGSGSVAIYIMVVQSYWNVVQITICVFSAMAFVVCGYFGQYARGETGRRSVPWKEWDNLVPQTSEIPYGRWSALCPPVYFSILCLINKKKKPQQLVYNPMRHRGDEPKGSSCATGGGACIVPP